MMHEEMLKAQERDVADVCSVPASRPANLLERTLPDTSYLRVVEPGEVVAGLAGDAKLALLDSDRAGLRLHGVEDFVGFLTRELELLDRLRDLLVGELLRSVSHACAR